MPQLGIDISNWTGEITAKNARAMKNALGIERAIIAAQFPQTYFPASDVLSKAGYTLDAYIYLYNTDSSSYLQQAQSALDRIYGSPYTYLWLDIEDVTPSATIVDEINELINALENQNIGVYTGYWYWPAFTGNLQIGSRVPLWTANWDNNSDGNFEVDYGGWKHALVKQYKAGYQYNGLNLDLDAWS